MFLASAPWDVPITLLGLLGFALAGVIVCRSPFYRELVSREAASTRFHAIDGLRGYLALGVLLHHTALNYQYYQTGQWGLVPSNLCTFLGRGSVAFFFMITAFLFWNRAIDEDGHLDTYKFYFSRLRRIVPMYFFAAALTVVTALTLTGFRLEVSPLELARQICAWLLFTIPGSPSINNFADTWLINTVFWSLVCEWFFYLILPFMAVFARPRHRWYWTIGMAIYIWLFSKSQFEWFFLAGCIAATVTRYEVVRKVAATGKAAFVAVGCIVATIVYVPLVYHPLGAALMLVSFVIFAAGNTLFGLLSCRPARLLGLLSYSVYLLHNWVLFVISRMVNHYTGVGTLAEEWYWGLGALMTLATVACASVTYRFIENPYLRSSSRVTPHIGTIQVRQSS